MTTAKIGNDDVIVGAPTVTGYIVQDVTDPAGADIDMEDIIDHSTGQLVTRLVFQVHKKINLTLITTTGTPSTDFPIGTMKEVLGQDMFIDDVQIAKSRAGQRVTVACTNIGLDIPV